MYNLEIEKEFELLSKELKKFFSQDQILQWAKESEFKNDNLNLNLTTS